jgi:hypothetical protein
MDVEGNEIFVTEPDPGDARGIDRYAYTESHLAGCMWDTLTAPIFGGYVTVLPGSRWAWEGLDKSTWTPISVAGAVEAFRHDAAQSGAIVIEILVKDSWLQANTIAGEQEARLLTGLEAMLPGLPIVPT